MENTPLYLGGIMEGYEVKVSSLVCIQIRGSSSMNNTFMLPQKDAEHRRGS